MKSVVVGAGGLGHLVHLVPDDGELGVDVVGGGLGLVAQRIGVVLEQVPDQIAGGVHRVHIGGDLAGETVGGAEQVVGSVIESVGGLVCPGFGLVQVRGGLVADVLPLAGEVIGQSENGGGGIPDIGQVATRVQGGKGQLQSPDVIPRCHQLSYLLEVSVEIFHLLVHLGEGILDGHALPVDVTGGIIQGFDGLGESAVRAGEHVVQGGTEVIRLL